MGKQGPCYHCGVTSTPLWRNGPPEKPVLCNACGSRWRTKGTLVNYTPLHSRADPDEFEDCHVSRVKSISLKNKEAKLLKRKQNHENASVGGLGYDCNQGFKKALDEDMSNRSSSGSAISNSDSCMQLGNADASDLTGPAQSVVWDTMIPSKNRTCVNRPKQSSVEKLTKDLHTILHEQQSYFSASSEEDLLFESEAPMVSVEIGHGSVLIRHPSSLAREEESEASSVSFDNKPHHMSEAYSCLTTSVHNDNLGFAIASRGIEKYKRPTAQGLDQDRARSCRDKLQDEILYVLENLASPLCYIDLKDVINFEEFSSHIASEELHQLLKYLPPVDTSRQPDSLKSMFESSQFQENLSSFQKLLAEGVFDQSFSLAKSDGCKALKKLALSNVTKSNWVEQYSMIQGAKYKNNFGGPEVASGHSMNVKRTRDPHFPGAKTTMKSPKKVLMKSTDYEQKEIVDNDSMCFSPRSLFALPANTNLNSFQYADESYDQDLLLDVPSNSSFPQAELLLPTSSSTARATTSSSSIHQNHLYP